MAAKIDFWTDKFELSHGKSPRGFGSWAFALNGHELDDGDSPNILWVHQSNFTNAKKVAKEHFLKGRQSSEVVRVHVLP